jgi:hypothetical protein
MRLALKPKLSNLIPSLVSSTDLIVAEVLLFNLIIRGEFWARPRKHDLTGLQHVPAMRYSQCHQCVLLDQQNRFALLVQTDNRIENRFDEQR